MGFFAKGIDRPTVSSCLGFALVLAIITASRLDSSGAADEGVVSTVLSMAFYLILWAVISAFARSGRLVPTAAFLYPALSLAGCLAFALNGGTSIIAGVLLGCGIACGYCTWGHVSMRRNDPSSTTALVIMILFWGILAFAASSVALLEHRMAVLAAYVVVSFILLITSNRSGATFAPAFCADEEGGESPGLKTLASALTVLWKPILIVSILGFTSGFFRSYLPMSGFDLATINVVRLSCTVAVWAIAFFLQLAWKRDLNIMAMFAVSLVAVASAFLLAPFMTGSYQILLLGIVDCVYMLMMFYLILACQRAAKERRPNAFTTFGLAEGIVSLIVGASFVVRQMEATRGEALPFSTFAVSLIVLYLLVLILIIMSSINGMEKPSRAPVVKIITTYPENAVRENPDLRDRYRITDREMDVLVLALSGRNARAIADVLFVSENTVRTHLKKIYRKLDVHKKEELHRFVHGLLEKHPPSA